MAVLSGSGRRQTSSSVLTLMAQGVWFEELVNGTPPTVAPLAAAEGVTGPYVSNVIDMEFIAPATLNTVFSDTSVFGGSMGDLKQLPSITICWADQSLPIHSR